MSINEEDVLNAEYESCDIRRDIKGYDNMRYTATQVAAKYNIPVSKVRYYGKIFEDILDIEVVNKRRVFTNSSLEKFEYILKLRNEDGLTVQQILEYSEREDIFTEDGLQASNNPLPVEMLSAAVTMQVSRMLEEFKSDIISEIMSELNQSNAALKEDLITTIDDIVSEKLEVVDDLEKNITNKVSDIKENLSEYKDNSNVYFEDIKHTISNIENNQEETIKAAYLNLDQIREQMNARRPWYEKLIDKIINYK